jgi:hypothetical protein
MFYLLIFKLYNYYMIHLIYKKILGKMPWHDFEFDNPIAAIMKIGLGDDLPIIPE